MSRLVIISNRLPLGDKPSGGLVVALEGAMRQRGGLWIGTSVKGVDVPSDQLKPHGGAAFDRLEFEISHEEQANYYSGYANSVLWPLFHGRTDLLDFKPEYFAAYKSVNARLAQQTAKHLRPDDIIWIHDYHLIPLAYELRRQGVSCKIGFFLHIPFPTASEIRALSDFDSFADWFSSYDLVGLQTRRDVDTLIDVMRHIPGHDILSDGVSGAQLKYGARKYNVSAFPISIDTQSFTKLAEANVDAVRPLFDPEIINIIGVDRLDYSKGLPNRIEGFQEFLGSRPMAAPKVSLLQISPPTRESVDAYTDIREELEQLTGRVNGRFSLIGYTPVQYIHRSVARESLAGIYRIAKVGLVTPLADGMNLVAKEYIAAQDPDDPGILVLSRFAGAAEQMGDGALIINPYDSGSIACALERAVSMPLSERQARHKDLMAGLTAQDIHWWRQTFLDSLADAPIQTKAEPDKKEPEQLAIG